MINIKRTFKFYCLAFGFEISDEKKCGSETIYNVKYQSDCATIVIDDDSDEIVVTGEKSFLQQALNLWANKSHDLEKSQEGGIVTNFSQEWCEWNWDAKLLEEKIQEYGVPKGDEIPDEYRFLRDRIFHDYMFRNKMSSTIEWDKAVSVIKSWFDKNCFMNIFEMELFPDLAEKIMMYDRDFLSINTSVEFEILSTSLCEAMAPLCSKKMIKCDKFDGCPQVRRDNAVCILNLVDHIYPYTDANEVVAFTKANLNNFVSKGGRGISWKGLAPSTPIEEIMDKKLKEAAYPIVPQYQAYDDNHKYRLDFLINTGCKYNIAIECDGLEFHARPNQYILDRKRDRYLQSKKILLMHFSSVEIFNEIDSVIDEIDRFFWKLKKDEFTPGSNIRASYFCTND